MIEGEKPLVTIVTITFNLIKAQREDSFRQCLESVHDQTYSNIEHIIIDGASKDGTIELINEYAKKGWVKYYSEPDSGIYDAMNKGIKHASGKYIVFLNSDDYYHGKSGIEASVKALEESRADFSYAPALMLKEDGSNYENHPHCKPEIKNVFITMPFCHQTMLTRRDVMLKEGMFDSNFKSAGDYEFLLRLCLKNYRSIPVDNVFTTYSWGGFSISANAPSIQEAGDAYQKNYSKLCSITRKECENIYCTNYSNIPKKLASKLKLNYAYFDYDKFKEINKLKRKIRIKLALYFNLFLNKTSFIIFSPRKFIKKYFKK